MPFWRKQQPQEPHYHYTVEATAFRVPPLCVACGAPCAQALGIPDWFEPDKSARKRLSHFRGGTSHTVFCGSQNRSATLTFPLCYEHCHLALPPEMTREMTKAERKERARLVSRSVRAKYQEHGFKGWTEWVHLTFANETFATAFAELNPRPDQALTVTYG